MNFFRKLSVKKQLTAAVLTAAILITVITAVWSYKLAIRHFREMSTQLTQNTVSALSDTVQTYFSRAFSYTTEILSDSALRQIAESSSRENARNSSLWQTMHYDIQLHIAAANNDQISFSSVEIHFKNGLSYSTRKVPYYKNYSECDAALDQKYGTSDGYIGIHWLPLPTEDERYQEPGCFRYIYNQRMEPIGVALFSLKTARMQKLISSVDSCYIMDTDGQILVSGNRSLIGSFCGNTALVEEIGRYHKSRTVTYKTDGSEQLVSYSPVGTANCYLVVPNTEYERLFRDKTREYQQSVVRMFIMSIVFAAAVSLIISQGISRDFGKLTDFIKKVDFNRDTVLRYQSGGNNEYDQIGARINTMLDSITAAEKQKEDGLRLNQTLELRLLQAQLNPHLLYNTLNSVIWNLENEKDDNAIHLIASLSGYFQYALSDGKQCIPLSDELKLIRYYLDLQHLARHKTFSFTAEIPEQIMDTVIPKLLLQPLVENSIRHGFDGYRSDGTISLTGTEENGVIRLILTDNGIGIMPDDLRSLQHMLDTEISISELKSFGLYGINRTIKQLFGREFGLQIESEIDRFTKVTVTVPYRRGTEGDNKNV